MIPGNEDRRPSHRRRASWHLVTGEFPPQPGGVSDYCMLLAEALASAGEEVHVWAPAASGPPRTGPVVVHRLTSSFGLQGLKELGSGLDAIPGPRRIFVQYVADAFGFRAMNLPFSLFISRRTEDIVWVMFHEYAYVTGWDKSPRQNLRGWVTSWMAALL